MRLTVKALCIGLCCLVALAAVPASATVRVGSWNLRHYGYHNHKNLTAVAQVISRFDVVALQEVMKPDAVQKLATLESRISGDSWKAVTSHTVGAHGYREGYAFIWRTNAVTYTGGATLYLDPGHHFLRQPFSAQFRPTPPLDGQGLVLATVHIKYGDSRADRAPEIRALADYWRWLGHTFPGEHRLLMGDFNTPPDAQAWAPLKALASPLITSGGVCRVGRRNRTSSLSQNRT